MSEDLWEETGEGQGEVSADPWEVIARRLEATSSQREESVNPSEAGEETSASEPELSADSDSAHYSNFSSDDDVSSADSSVPWQQQDR